MTDPLWLQLNAEQITALNQMFSYIETNTGFFDDDITNIRDRIKHYQSDALTDNNYRDEARQQPWVRDGECEIDDYAVVSPSDDGAYVMAWVWVDAEDEDEDEDEDFHEDTPSLDTSFHDHEMDV